MNQKFVLYSTLAMVILFGALYGVYRLVGGEIDSAIIEKVKSEKPTGRTMWNEKASHTLTVFSDHQCPACKIYHEYLSGFEASASPDISITKKVSFVFRYYPLYQIHQHAFSLAYAAEAANRQGKFEEITNRIFADQEKFEKMTDLKPYLAQVVKDLKLDDKKFQSDMNDKALQSVVQEDLSLGEKLSVNATPTFYLDGEKLEGMAPKDLGALLKKLN